MTIESPVSFIKADDGGVVLTQAEYQIELTSSQVAQAAAVLRLREAGNLEYREHPLRVTVGERHPRDIILQLDDGNVHLTQMGDCEVNTVCDTLAGMRRWCQKQ